MAVVRLSFRLINCVHLTKIKIYCSPIDSGQNAIINTNFTVGTLKAIFSRLVIESYCYSSRVVLQIMVYKCYFYRATARLLSSVKCILVPSIKNARSLVHWITEKPLPQIPASLLTCLVLSSVSLWGC